MGPKFDPKSLTVWSALSFSLRSSVNFNRSDRVFGACDRFKFLLPTFKTACENMSAAAKTPKNGCKIAWTALRKQLSSMKKHDSLFRSEKSVAAIRLFTAFFRCVYVHWATPATQSIRKIRQISLIFTGYDPHCVFSSVGKRAKRKKKEFKK